MKYSKKHIKTLKKRLLGCTVTIATSLMLIACGKLALLNTPINSLASIKNYISTALSGDEISGAGKETKSSTAPISYTGTKLQNTKTETYIYDAQDLCAFRDDVNSGNDYAGRTVYLMQDIDLSTVCGEDLGVSWIPIGTTGETTGIEFAGIFDGNYHTISKIYINNNQYQSEGLFWKNGANGIIQNIILNDISINNTYNKSYNLTGAIVGRNEGTILNCGTESGNISANNTMTSSANPTYVGGISGSSSYKISGCYNKALITVNSTGTEIALGGITGGSNTVTFVMENCYNMGNLNATSSLKVNIGGIIGSIYKDSTSKNITINNLYNTGIITGNSNIKRIGAIIGQNGYKNSPPRNPVSFSNCYYSDGEYSDTYWNGSSVSTGTTGKISEEELKTYATTLGKEFIEDKWEMNEGYPILWWQGPRLQLNKNQAYIKENGELQLSVMAAQSACPEEVMEEILKGEFDWTSTNENVATVDQNGKVTGKKDGYTTIYAHHKTENLYAMCVVNVVKETANPQIATGNGFTAILKSNGKVYTIGNNEQGQLGYEKVINVNDPQIVHTDIDTELTNVRKIAVGSNHVLALTNDGKVYSWGDNEYGQLGTGDIEDSKYATPVLGTDGASYLSNIVDIEAGGYGSVALDANGNVYVWGNGANGEIGNNNTESKSIPTKVVGVKYGIQVSIGNGHVGALTSDGVFWDWGLNTNGQLGINSTTNTSYPTRVALETTEISLGGYHTVIKKIDGTIQVTGIKNNGRIGIEGTGNQTTFEQVNLDEILTDGKKVKYIKAGQANTTILLSDGTVWETGFNLHGELGNGTNETKTTFVQGLTEENKAIKGVLTIGKNIGDVKGTEALGYGLDTAVILENGDIYTTGNNKYRQIGNNDIEDKTYYTKMWYAYLDYAEKSVEIEGTQGYQIDKDKIRYIQSVVNAYSKEPLLTVGNLKYSIQDTTLATVNSSGYIIANEGVTGATKVEIEDIDNKYKAYFTLIVNKLQNTDTVTYIYDSEDMCEFRDSVNAGNDYAGKSVYVMADIDMSDVCSSSIGSWEPIGIGTDEQGNAVYFSGTFDGNYHTIDNLYMNTNEYPYLGLFTQITANAVVQNIILKNVYINNTTYNAVTYTGGVVRK